MTTKHILIRVEAEDFDAWYREHAGHSGARRSFGLSDGPVYRDIDDPNAALAHISTQDLDKSLQWFKTPAFREASARAKVSGREIYIASQRSSREIAPEQIKATIIDAFLAAFNEGDFVPLEKICAPDMLDHSTAADPDQAGGLAGLTRRIAEHRTGMPDLHMTIERVTIEGDLVSIQWAIEGTNTGPYLGRPPSGNKIRIVGMNLERLENGQIVEHWSYPDKLALMQQLGLIPAFSSE